MDITLLPGGDFIMAKKGQNFVKYSKGKKVKAVQMNGEGGYEKDYEERRPW